MRRLLHGCHLLLLPSLAGRVIRVGGLPTAQQHEHQVLSSQRALQKVAEQRAAMAERRRLQLQRSKATYEMQVLMGDEEDVPPLPDYDDYGEELQDDSQPASAGCASHAAGGSSGQPSTSHAQRKLAFEQSFRQHTEQGLKYKTLLAPQLAEFERHDLQHRVETIQERVHRMARCLMAAHPGCPARGGTQPISWRPVLLRVIHGTGLIYVPLFRCVMS